MTEQSTAGGAATAPGAHEPYGGHAPHVRGSETSLAAATAQEVTAKLAPDELRVLRLAAECGDRRLIDDEIEVALGLEHLTASARRRGPVLKGCMQKKGGKRPTRRRCAAEVYAPTGVGRAELEDRERAPADGRAVRRTTRG